jgi:hypothetical protein
MKSMWQTDARRELGNRLIALTPDRRAEWGRMSAHQMVCHLTASVQMATGEKPVAPKQLPLRYPVIKHLVIYVLPFPRNAPTAPELVFASTPNAWSSDVEALQAALDRFIARGPEARWSDHPAFGRLSARAWGVLVYRHVDHHLRQFGV